MGSLVQVQPGERKPQHTLGLFRSSKDLFAKGSLPRDLGKVQPGERKPQHMLGLFRSGKDLFAKGVAATQQR